MHSCIERILGLKLLGEWVLCFFVSEPFTRNWVKILWQWLLALALIIPFVPLTWFTAYQIGHLQIWSVHWGKLIPLCKMIIPSSARHRVCSQETTTSATLNLWYFFQSTFVGKPQDTKYHVYLKSALLFLYMYDYRLNKITVIGKLNFFLAPWVSEFPSKTLEPTPFPSYIQKRSTSRLSKASDL